MPEREVVVNYYALLELPPASSVQQIRRAYRELSKLYHPDTTALPAAIATEKFQQLNEAYATLSSPERRVAYDLKLGYSRLSVIQPPANFNQPASQTRSYRSSAYLDPTDRPLSAGEIFAVFILGVTFVACLVLVVTISLARGEAALPPLTPNALEPIEAVISRERSPAETPVVQAVQPPLARKDSENLEDPATDTSPAPDLPSEPLPEPAKEVILSEPTSEPSIDSVDSPEQTALPPTPEPEAKPEAKPDSAPSHASAASTEAL